MKKQVVCDYRNKNKIIFKLYLYFIQGVSKKTPEFSCIRRIVVTFEPCNGFTNCFFLLKTEIHTQILNTEPILYDFRQPRYLPNKMGLL